MCKRTSTPLLAGVHVGATNTGRGPIEQALHEADVNVQYYRCSLHTSSFSHIHHSIEYDMPPQIWALEAHLNSKDAAFIDPF